MQIETINALIGAAGEVLAATVAMIGILFAAKRVLSRKKLRMDLILALKDIQFLLEVESVHNGISVAQNSKDNKIMVRSVVREEKGIDISGKNSLSKIKCKLISLSRFDD